jgi:multiple antibiotic resistance protein
LYPLLSLFVATFSTLLAIINPLEVLPVYSKLLSGAEPKASRDVAWKACLYAALLCFFFLIFGNLLLKLFGVPLSMVRIVGGIILMKIGFELFSPSKGSDFGDPNASFANSNIAFVPLAMPLMIGPGAIATIMGMTASIDHSEYLAASFVSVSLAISATMTVTYLCLVYSRAITARIGPMGIDAATRIVGFFVSAMGMGLIFNGVIEALEQHGITALH